jgi:hypothetical protein
VVEVKRLPGSHPGTEKRKAIENYRLEYYSLSRVFMDLFICP